MNLRKKKFIDKYVGFTLLAIITPISFFLGIILNRNHNIKEVSRSITLIKILGGGSLFTALVPLIALKKRYPKKKLILICSENTLSFAKLMGIFDRIIIIKTNNLWNLLITSFKALSKVSFTDVTIDLEVHSKLTSLFSLATFARNRVGLYSKYNSWQNGILTHKILFDESKLLSQYYEKAVRLFGIENFDYADLSKHIIINNNLKPYKKTSVINSLAIGPYCSELGREREFKDLEWIELFNKNKLDFKKIIIIGSKIDYSKSIQLEKRLYKWNSELLIENKVGKLSLKDSVQEILNADIFYTIDSGLNHILRQLKMSINSYWGPTDPKTRLNYLENSNEFIFYSKILCSPCVHLIDLPPCNGNNICMKQHIKTISLKDAYSNSLQITRNKNG
tara:strand:- start:3592 stop:4770 length:1179 start_codon:yes stop_codon:yes gene_type:complete